MRLFVRSHDTKAKSFAELNEILNNLKLDGVQLVTYKTFPDMFAYECGVLNAEIAEKIRLSLDGKICLIGAYFNPVHSNAEKRQRGIDVFKEYLTYARTMGGEFVGSETGSFNDDKWTFHPQNRTKDALNKVIKTFSKLCDYASDFGSSVAIEGAAGHICYDVKTLSKAKRAIAHKNLKIIFDLYNFLDNSNAEKYLDILQEGLDEFNEDILLFHIKDCVFKNGELKQVAVGKGEFDFSKILAKIKRHNKDATLVFEGTAIEDLEASVELIRNVLEQA